MAGVEVKGDLTVDRDLITDRDAEIKGKLTVDLTAEVKGKLTVDTDAEVKRDLTVVRNVRASRYSHGSLTTSAASLVLTTDSPYQIIVEGTFIKLISLPTVSATPGADFGNGSEFRITNDMEPAAEGATIQNNVVLIAAGAQVGDSITAGKTGIVFCKNAAATQQPLAWELVIIDEFSNQRLGPIAVAIHNDLPTVPNSENSWVLSSNSQSYTAQFIVPDSKLPFPIVTIKDNNFHNILVDQFSIGGVVHLNVTATPDARFSGRIEFA